MPDTSALPKYIQVSEMLIREIAAGHLADGARLPPEREMADDLGIAIGTLRKALADVAAKGLLQRRQGSGNYITHRPVVDSVYAFFRLELLRGGGLPTAELLTVDRLAKPAGLPACGQADSGHRIRRLRLLDGQRVALEEIWLDGARADRINPDELSESLYHYYRNALGIVIASVEDRISVGAAPDWSPPAFQLKRGQPCGYIERIGQTADKANVEFSRTWFDGTHARYVSRMGKG
ncbi:GntR family transcriptional regulator [Yoonia sp. SS1-5]|uniref:GntR family transcriptional regulator n=1 Tax=Yoonia rhodophyticola TaxID=3137370 RepID=A0ABZ3JBM3_9RHOB